MQRRFSVFVLASIVCVMLGNLYSTQAIPPRTAKVQAVVSFGFVVDYVVIDGGAGYLFDKPPTVLILGGGGVGATATAIVTTGAVTSVTVVSPGSGYISIPDVQVDPPPKYSIMDLQLLTARGHNGTGVDVEFIDSITNQWLELTNVILGNQPPLVMSIVPPLSPVAFYRARLAATNISSQPRVAEGTPIVVNKFVVSVNVTNGGQGYISTPTVTIEGGGGSGATAFASISNGSVNGVTMINPGSGYTSKPSVKFSLPDTYVELKTKNIQVRGDLGNWVNIDWSENDTGVWTPFTSVLFQTNTALVGDWNASLLTQRNYRAIVTTNPPAIQVTLTNIDFGYAHIGTPSDYSVYITNVGDGLLIGHATVNPPFSILSGGNYQLLTYQGQTIVLRYCPLTPGTNTSLLSFAGGQGVTGSVVGIGYEQLIPMALIPGGEFTMGDTFSEGLSDELPLHTVNISAFYMDKYEVSKSVWDFVYTWATRHGYSFNYAGSGKASSHPVHSMSWYDAVKWCNARSEMEGRTPAYYTSAAKTTVYRTGQVIVQNDWVNWNAGYRLPTEAEWEYAARGGASGQRFPWGNTITHSQANYYSSSNYAYDTSPTRGHIPIYLAGDYPYTSPVGSFAPNGYGLYDMAGNVYEWCWDLYSTSYSSASQSDPKGPTSGSYRVGRGGCWGHNAFGCRTAYHYYFTPSYADIIIGFRSVLPSGQP